MLFYTAIWLVCGIILALLSYASVWFWVLQGMCLLFCRRFLLAAILIIIGMQYYQVRYHYLTAWQLPKNWIKRPLVVDGRVSSLPKKIPHAEQFLFKTTDHHLFRLSWYNSNVPIHYGEKWRFTVSLKPPAGLLNPGGFDYGRWLILNGIQATGYIKNNKAQLLAPVTTRAITRWRETLQHEIASAIKNPDIAGLIAALTVGSHDLIQKQQWQVFQNTGTNHLMAISGLHIGFVAGFGFFLIGLVWRRSTRLMLWQPVQYAQAIAAIIAALMYGMMAGLSLPTQRAVLMITVVMLALLSRQTIYLWMRLCLAFCLVVIWDPFVLYSASLWMSFGSVVWIAYVCSGRLKGYSKSVAWWRLQWALLIGLAPLTLYFYHQVSVVGFVANAVAVPWVGFLIVPICLVAAALSGVSMHLSMLVFVFAGKCIAPLWLYLQWLAQKPWAVWLHVIPNIGVLILALIAAIFLLLPRGIPGRGFGLFLLLPLFFYKPPGPKAGQIWVTTLAVGQGLSTVLRTAHHTLLYDAGPKSYSGFDAGASVVVPYLQSQGINTLDMMMISHGDNDHIGGAPAVLQSIPTQTILTSVPWKFKTHAVHCYRGERWQWDGVDFQVLWPPKGQPYEDNNSSCVLRIAKGRSHILFTGDIEAPAETWMLRHERGLLAATAIIAPHHGSCTSSTSAFVAAVHPKLVVFPTGAYNRYHFPSLAVQKRYQKIGSKEYNTAVSGAITMQFTDKGLLNVKTARGKSKKLL